MGKTKQPSKAKPRPVDDFGGREHTKGKICVEANGLQHGLAGDILAAGIPAHGGVISVDGEVLFPVFGSGVDLAIFLFNKLEQKVYVRICWLSTATEQDH